MFCCFLDPGQFQRINRMLSKSLVCVFVSMCGRLLATLRWGGGGKGGRPSDNKNKMRSDEKVNIYNCGAARRMTKASSMLTRVSNAVKRPAEAPAGVGAGAGADMTGAGAGGGAAGGSGSGCGTGAGSVTGGGVGSVTGGGAGSATGAGAETGAGADTGPYADRPASTGAAVHRVPPSSSPAMTAYCSLVSHPSSTRRSRCLSVSAPLRT